METPEKYGKMTEKSWQNREKIMENSLKNHGKFTEKS